MENTEVQTMKYAGFWRRVFASVVDEIWQLLIIGAFLSVDSVFDDDILILLSIVVMIFFIKLLKAFFIFSPWQATPGKKLFGIKVETEAGEKLPSFWKAFLRENAFFIALYTIALVFLFTNYGREAFEGDWSLEERIATMGVAFIEAIMMTGSFTSSLLLCVIEDAQGVEGYTFFFYCGVGVFWFGSVLFTKQKTTFHDRLFNTRVVYVKPRRVRVEKPGERVDMSSDTLRYGGFWRRLFAACIDYVLGMVLVLVLAMLFFLFAFSLSLLLRDGDAPTEQEAVVAMSSQEETADMPLEPAYENEEYEERGSLQVAREFSKSEGGYILVFVIFLIPLTIVMPGAIKALFLRSRWQATPGKKALGLKVVFENGARLTFGRAFWRESAYALASALLTLGLVALFLVMIGSTVEITQKDEDVFDLVSTWLGFVLTMVWFLPVAFTKEKKAVHDMMFKTRVICLNTGEK